MREICTFSLTRGGDIARQAWYAVFRHRRGNPETRSTETYPYRYTLSTLPADGTLALAEASAGAEAKSGKARPLARYCGGHRRDAHRHCECAPVTSSRAASIKMQKRRGANLRVRAEEDQNEKTPIEASSSNAKIKLSGDDRQLSVRFLPFGRSVARTAGSASHGTAKGGRLDRCENEPTRPIRREKRA